MDMEIDPVGGAIMCTDLKFPNGYAEEDIDIIKEGYAHQVGAMPFINESTGEIERLPEDEEMIWAVDNYFDCVSHFSDHIVEKMSNLTMIGLREAYFKAKANSENNVFGGVIKLN